MNTFQYYSYLFYAAKEKSEFEKIYEDFAKKIELYEKQYEITLILYKSERTKELEELKQTFSKAEIIANLNYKKAYEDVAAEDESNRHSYASHISGLDQLTHSYHEDIENINVKYFDFFDLYSKTLLTALYSIVESKLKEICKIVSNDFGLKIKYDHLDARDYLNTSFVYLELVSQINIDTLKPYLSKLKNIQHVRNKIIHSESKFNEGDQKAINELVKNSNGALVLHKDNLTSTLKIKKREYILDLFELIRELFEELIWLVDIKQGNKTLLKGLEYWFGILDNKIFIKKLQINKVGIGSRNIQFTLSSRKKGISKFNCIINISRAKSNSLEIIDQTDNLAIREFNELVKSMNYFLFDYVFKLFNQNSKGLKIKVMMFSL
jgi:hypothetical protein